MARSKNNPLLKGASGAVGKTLIVKQYAYGTVLSNYPDMSRIEASAPQRECRSRFKQAVAFANSVKSDPKKSAAYKKKLKRHISIYHAALADFLKSAK